MPARDDLRLIIGDISASPRYSNENLDTFLNLAITELNSLNVSTYEVQDLDTPSIVPSWFKMLIYKRAHIQIVFADFTNPAHFKKIQVQDTSKDPGDGASRVKKLLDALIAEYDKFAANYLPTPTAGVLGFLINYTAEIGNDSLIA